MAKNLDLGQPEEGQTPPGDLSGLLVPAKTLEELNRFEAKNNTQAYKKYLLFLRSKKINLLATTTLCEIHKEMFGQVWSWAGEFRQVEKTIGVAPAKIGSELHRLLSEFHQWEDKKVSPGEIAVRIHHRLVEIHPFENGNGRWARLVTNIYLRMEGQTLIEWPYDPKVIREDFKPKYLAALRKADAGEYALLAQLHHSYIKN